MLLQPIRIGIVDDHTLFRKTLRNFLSDQKNLHVSLLASNLFELLQELEGNPIDVLLMDIFMPGLVSSQDVKAIRSGYPDMKVLILSMSIDMEVIVSLLEAGIHGFISKSEEPEQLMLAIQAISENRIYRTHLFTEALYLSKQNKINTYSEDIRLLSEREKRILQLIWEEKSNKEIADELFLGVRSVEKIRQDMKEKIGVHSTVGLLKYAIHKKIIGVGAPISVSPMNNPLHARTPD